MIARTACLLALFPLAQAVEAQGFAGLGTSADGFSIPNPDYEISFPLDHGPHSDYRIEWWYVTANLKVQNGQDMGIQWTLFRTALEPGETDGWNSPQVWMGHAAVTTADDHLFSEKIARGGIGQAGVTATPFDAWIDNWEMTGDPNGTVSLKASDPAFSYTLDLTSKAPVVFQGQRGYSVKSSEGQASHYYSLPHFDVSGQVVLNGTTHHVAGQAWLDREWSSQPLSEDQHGWDWFSLSFDTGDKLMGFLLRGKDEPFVSGTWIPAHEAPQQLTRDMFQAIPLSTSRVADRDIPTKWAVTLPDHGVSVTVAAINPNSWMGTTFSYWEGPVTITGSHTGRGYLEMTGYD